MSGVSSSTGLVSGIPTGDLIDQLMAIEARTKNTVSKRVQQTETKKAAWMTLSASVLGLKMASSSFGEVDTFDAAAASSSNESVIKATASTGATPGSYQFTVRRLAQNHQLISAGFSASSSTVGPGEITFDIGAGRLDHGTKLDFLNGQTGVRRGSIRITDRAGTTADVDLTEAITVSDVVETINAQAGLGVVARVSNDSIVLDDTTGAGGSITVAEVGAGKTAEDLGLLGSVAGPTLTGSSINTITAETSLDLLNDGLGIERSKAVEDLVLTLRDGTQFTVNLLGAFGQEDQTAHTVGDVIDAINNAQEADATPNGGRLVASIGADGKSISLVDTTGGPGDLIVADGAGSSAATQLGLAGTYAGGPGDLAVDGKPLIAGLDSVMLRNLQGGAGLTAGQLTLRDRLDNAATVDLSGASSVSDVIDGINNAGIGLHASLNDAGNGLKIVDTTGSTDFRMVVADATGDLASTLGIAVDADVDEVGGGNAQHKYVSTQTKLDDLAGAGGWTGGKIKITNTLGVSIEANLGASNVVRVQDALQNINAVSETIGVTARLNDTGTGIILEDANGGANALAVSEVSGGSVARTLGLFGEAETGEAFIDGSFRKTISIGADDTLADVAAKINGANADVTASIINDGSGANPYRLVLLSENTGSAGEIVFDAGASGLNMTTFSQARDALVYLGTPGDANALALTSSENQLTEFVDGVTFDLLGTDDNPVTVTVERDTESVTASIKSFTESFNSLIGSIDKFTSFDAETLEKGTLFADSNVSLLRSRLMNMVLGRYEIESGGYASLSEIGLSLTAGNKLAFDESKFLEAYEADRDGVVNLFTEAADTEEVVEGGETVEKNVAGTGGVGANFESILDDLSDQYDGFITNITESLDTRIEDMNDRIEQIDVLLESKRARYERQFASMELAISKMQSQQSALSSLASLASSFGASL